MILFLSVYLILISFTLGTLYCCIKVKKHTSHFKKVFDIVLILTGISQVHLNLKTGAITSHLIGIGVNVNVFYHIQPFELSALAFSFPVGMILFWLRTLSQIHSTN